VASVRNSSMERLHLGGYLCSREQGECAPASVAFDKEDVIGFSWVEMEPPVDANAPRVAACSSLNDLAQSTTKNPLLMEGTI
jgi:hypothetical protein